MLRHLFAGLFALLPVLSNGQVQFQKGSFTTNDGQEVTCFILNEDWGYNPTQFKYRLTEQGSPTTAQLEEVTRFGVSGVFLFERHEVPVEMSSDHIAALGTNPNPVFETRTVFLKVLSKGSANLYSYAHNGKTQFFHSTTEGTPMPLIYKRYRKPDGSIGQVNTFRQTLFLELNCPGWNKAALEEMDYTEAQLRGVFDRFNRCTDPEYTNAFNQAKPLILKVGLRVGVSYSSAEFNSLAISFDPNTGLRFGINLEAFLPIQRYKWAVFMEAAYRSFEAEQETTFYRSFALDYPSIEFALGGRHYMYLNTRHAVFIGAYFLGDMDLDAKINAEGSLQTDFAYDVEPVLNAGLSIGWSMDKKWSLDLRYDLDRNLLRDNQTEATYKNVSLILGYSFN